MRDDSSNDRDSWTMRKKRNCDFYGYVKVELVSQFPRRWSWSVRRDAGDIVTFQSDAPFKCAEDAWAAGRRVLTALENGEMADQSAQMAEAD